MKFSNKIKTVLKIYQKYVKNSVWFGTGQYLLMYSFRDDNVTDVLRFEIHLSTVKPVLSGHRIKRTPSIKRTVAEVPKFISLIYFK